MDKNIKDDQSSVKDYFILWFVVLVWAFSPIVSKFMYSNYFSPVFLTVILNCISIITLLILSAKKLKLLNKGLLKIAIPTGLANTCANLLQKIGLQYTTPAKYAFLENLSCVVVPILVFIFIHKKPNIYKILASILCLVGAFFLSGMSFSSQSLSFGKGELLCALAGLLYGFNIAGTGVYAKNFDSTLYVFVHQMVALPVNFTMMIILGFVPIGNVIVEPIRYSFTPFVIFMILYMALISSTLCWHLRTKVAKKIDPTVVGVIMPFSAVITAVVSILLKMDTLSLTLILGISISLIAVFVSTFGDYVDRKRERSL